MPFCFGRAQDSGFSLLFLELNAKQFLLASWILQIVRVKSSPPLQTCIQVYTSQFIISCRAEASAGRLAELNPYVTVQTSTCTLNGKELGFLRDYQVLSWKVKYIMELCSVQQQTLPAE